jgi:hypothetical protein
VPYVKTAKFSLHFMGMMGKKRFLILFLFSVLYVVRKKIQAPIFLIPVLTNMISCETIKSVYRMTRKSLFQVCFIAALWYVNTGVL